MAVLNVHQMLQQKLASHPVGAPPRQEFLEILRILFTPEQANLATHLTFVPQTTEVIARLTGLSPETVSTLCETMARDGLILSVVGKTGTKYGLLPLVPGLFEFPLMLRLERGGEYGRLSELWLQYYENGWGQEVTSSKPPLVRVLPILKAIDTGTAVLPFDQVYDYLDKAEIIAVGHCPCRLISRRCQAPTETCMYSGAIARFLIDRGGARQICKAEAVNILRRSEDAGLVHCASNTADRIDVICNCCPCCCLNLRAIIEWKGTSRPVSSLNSLINEAECTACGICVDRCPVKAITVDRVATIDASLCIGCGLCVSACPAHAATLVRRAVPPEPPRTGLDWALQAAEGKGRLEEFVSNLRPQSHCNQQHTL